MFVRSVSGCDLLCLSTVPLPYASTDNLSLGERGRSRRTRSSRRLRVEAKLIEAHRMGAGRGAGRARQTSRGEGPCTLYAYLRPYPYAAASRYDRAPSAAALRRDPRSRGPGALRPHRVQLQESSVRVRWLGHGWGESRQPI